MNTVLTRVARSRHSQIAALGWRALWALMLVGHGPALIAAWEGWLEQPGAAGTLVRCLGLTLSSLFFLLKLWDVQRLRFRGGRRALVAGVAVVALLHAGVPARLAGQDGDVAPHMWCVAVWGGGALLTVAALLNVGRVVRGAAGRSVGRRDHVSLMLFLRRNLDAIIIPLSPLMVRACRLNRAPPALGLST